LIGSALAYPAARLAIGALRDREPERGVALGGRAGRAWVKTRAPRVAEARFNIAIAFPDRSAEEREHILLTSFENFGRSAVEVALLHGRHREALFARVHAEGEENLEHALEASDGGGLLILTAHFGSWELCGAALAARGHPVTSIHRARRDDRLDSLVKAWRERSGQEVIPIGAAGLGVLRALRRGRYVTMLMDQNARRDEGIFAPFFGVEACTRSGPAHIAASLGIPIVPLFFHRVDEGPDHIARFHPPLQIAAEPADASPDQAQTILRANVALMNRAIEDAIRADPGQWMWAHRRYRTRPEGEPRLYPKRSGWMRRLRHLRKR
jgi:KDO2-lipid IV(A) lauroyltransferase